MRAGCCFQPDDPGDEAKKLFEGAGDPWNAGSDHSYGETIPITQQAEEPDGFRRGGILASSLRNRLQLGAAPQFHETALRINSSNSSEGWILVMFYSIWLFKTASSR